MKGLSKVGVVGVMFLALSVTSLLSSVEAQAGALSAQEEVDYKKQLQIKNRALRQLSNTMKGLSAGYPVSFESFGPDSLACACVCSSATGNVWSCDPTGCSSKDGTSCQ